MSARIWKDYHANPALISSGKRGTFSGFTLGDQIAVELLAARVRDGGIPNGQDQEGGRHRSSNRLVRLCEECYAASLVMLEVRRNLVDQADRDGAQDGQRRFA